MSSVALTTFQLVGGFYIGQQSRSYLSLRTEVLLVPVDSHVQVHSPASSRWHLRASLPDKMRGAVESESQINDCFIISTP